jgi:hypothetical protein
VIVTLSILKEEMERIWGEENIACPCHLVRWIANTNVGYNDKSKLLSYMKGYQCRLLTRERAQNIWRS